jgi:hypothetical protein
MIVPGVIIGIGGAPADRPVLLALDPAHLGAPP